MKPRPTSSRQFYSIYWTLIVVIFLKDAITAQPIPYRRLTTSHVGSESRPQHPTFESPPSHGQLSPPPCDCATPVTVPNKPKTPQPIFFPYVVPIPWPTPFNGTDYAPVPDVKPAKLPISEPLKDDAYPLYIPYPQFEYVPLYYNEHSTPSSQKSCSRSPAKEYPLGKSVKKPVFDPYPIYISPPSKSPKSLNPTEPEQLVDPIYGNFLPLKDFVPPPKHTWVPPPDDFLEEISPPPSALHTRSLATPYGKKTYDYGPYGPDFVSFADDKPHTYNHYYQEPTPYNLYNPYAPRRTYYDPYARRVEKTPFVTYGSEFVTYTEPSRYGADDAFFTFGPNVVTYIDDAPVPPYPTRSTFPTSRSRSPFQVNQHHSSSWEYNPSRPYPSEYQSPRPSPPIPNGGRSSAFSPPAQEDFQWVYYKPETITVVDDDKSQYIYNPYPASPPRSQPPVTIGGRSSIFAPPVEPKPEEDIGYVLYEPEVFHIVESDNGEKSIIYGPKIVRVIDDEPKDINRRPVEKPTGTYFEEEPGYYTFTDPEEELFKNTQIDVPQRLVEDPPPSDYATLVSNPGTTTIT